MEEQFDELVKLFEDFLKSNTDEFVTNAGPAMVSSLTNSLLNDQAANQVISTVDLEGLTVPEFQEIIETTRSIIYNKMIKLKEQYSSSTAKQEFCDMAYSLFEMYFNYLTTYYFSRNNASVGVELMNDAAKLPAYAHEGDQGADISSAEDITILPHTYGNVVHTGIKLLIPPTWAVSIRPRSGLSKKTTLRISNSPATIDQQYRGEVMILFDNIGDSPVEIKAGERIAQLIFEKNYQAKYTKVDSVEPTTERGEGGFGSTGMN